jgi:hypothetical protein
MNGKAPVMTRRIGRPPQQCDLHRDDQPADAVVVRLFSNLQLARWVKANNRKEAVKADEYERTSWRYLLDYLATLERPDVRTFDLLK